MGFSKDKCIDDIVKPYSFQNPVLTIQSPVILSRKQREDVSKQSCSTPRSSDSIYEGGKERHITGEEKQTLQACSGTGLRMS